MVKNISQPISNKGMHKINKICYDCNDLIMGVLYACIYKSINLKAAESHIGVYLRMFKNAEYLVI